MLSAFTNCFKIPELRQRILLTLGLVFIARVGAGIPLPGLDPTPLQAYYASAASDASGLAGLYNMFTGGAMMNGAIFALGIMPYISASIILQLMGAVMPSLARLMQEGDSGRQKIAQYTRYLTIAIALIQGVMITYALAYSPETMFSGFDKAQFGSIIVSSNMAVFFIVSVILMTTGCMILTWLAYLSSLLSVLSTLSRGRYLRRGIWFLPELSARKARRWAFRRLWLCSCFWGL